MFPIKVKEEMFIYFYMGISSFPRSFAEDMTFSLVYIFDASVK